MMILEMMQSFHPPPGSVGLITRMGFQFLQQSIYEKNLLGQRKMIRKKLDEVIPPQRLHISGERYYVH